MQTWTLTEVPANSARPSRPQTTAECLHALVGAIGDPRFALHALDLMKRVLPVDFWAVYCLYGERAPRMFLSASGTGHDVSTDCFRSYQGGLYRDDRTLGRAAELSRASHALAMTLWNEAEFPSAHRDRIYRRHAIHERMSIVAHQGGDTHLCINLYRFQKSGSYRATELEAAESMAELLVACVIKHLEIQALLEDARREPRVDTRERLRARNGRLTPREIDVCERLLRGWTYEGIAADLGLSVTSVKTYRARAFDRLGIHFRNELFALVGYAGSGNPS